MHPWKLKKSEIVFDDFLQITKDTYALPNGKESAFRYLSNIDTAAVLAATPQQKLVLIKQFRPSVKQTVLEMPGGIIDTGENPRTTAKRELEEETGYVAKQLILLGTYYLSPGGSGSLMHLYFARVTKTGKQTLEPEEDVTVVLKTKKELHKLFDKNNVLVRGALPLALYVAERRGLV